MDDYLTVLLAKVEQQGTRVKQLETDMHTLIEQLGKERQAYYYLKQELKAKQK